MPVDHHRELRTDRATTRPRRCRTLARRARRSRRQPTASAEAGPIATIDDPVVRAQDVHLYYGDVGSPVRHHDGLPAASRSPP